MYSTLFQDTEGKWKGSWCTLNCNIEKRSWKWLLRETKTIRDITTKTTEYWRKVALKNKNITAEVSTELSETQICWGGNTRFKYRVWICVSQYGGNSFLRLVSVWYFLKLINDSETPAAFRIPKRRCFARRRFLETECSRHDIPFKTKIFITLHDTALPSASFAVIFDTTRNTRLVYCHMYLDWIKIVYDSRYVDVKGSEDGKPEESTEISLLTTPRRFQKVPVNIVFWDIPPYKRVNSVRTANCVLASPTSLLGRCINTGALTELPAQSSVLPLKLSLFLLVQK